ncbi:MAG: ion transporter [Alphaproteobacteria bacterium]|nr:ion transporter [Alphaproteobacteria bacterium]
MSEGELDLRAKRTGTGWRRRLAEFAESQPAQKVVMTLIVVNAVTLGLETSATVMATAGTVLHILDSAVLAVFVLEIAAKLVGRGWRFFTSGWNVFDFIVVSIALVPSAGPFSVLRALRVLRVLRLLSVIPQMRHVIESLLRAVPGIGSIMGILILIFYVFAVIATNLFGARFDDWFGTVGKSMYSLFQIMTLESWSMGIVRPVMRVYPYAWAFFVPFILIATFTMLNLFIAIIVSAMQAQAAQEHEAEMEAIEEAHADESALIQREIGALRKELGEVRRLLEARERPPDGA